MSELHTMLSDSVSRLFEKLVNSDAVREQPACLSASHWQTVEDFGLADLLLPEAENGFNGGWQDAGILFRLLGAYAIPLPIGETVIAKKLLYDAGATPSSVSALANPAAISIANCQNATLTATKDSEDWRFSGTLDCVPWGSQVSLILVGTEHQGNKVIALLKPDDAVSIERGKNCAEESRDRLTFEQAPLSVILPVAAQQLSLLNAGLLLRTGQIAGALESMLELSTNYVSERKQFGRAIAKFQVIQHDLARLAEQTAMVSCVSQVACRAADFDNADFEITAAKLRANHSIATSTSIAHQVHGAIGFTEEHDLHYFTQRLFAWRSEFATDRILAGKLGRLVLSMQQNSLWHFLTERSDAMFSAKPDEASINDDAEVAQTEVTELS